MSGGRRGGRRRALKLAVNLPGSAMQTVRSKISFIDDQR